MYDDQERLIHNFGPRLFKTGNGEAYTRSAQISEHKVTSVGVGGLPPVLGSVDLGCVNPKWAQ